MQARWDLSSDDFVRPEYSVMAGFTPRTAPGGDGTKTSFWIKLEKLSVDTGPIVQSDQEADERADEEADGTESTPKPPFMFFGFSRKQARDLYPQQGLWTAMVVLGCIFICCCALGLSGSIH